MDRRKIENMEDLLPELNEEEIEWAVAPDKQSWVYLASVSYTHLTLPTTPYV